MKAALRTATRAALRLLAHREQATGKILLSDLPVPDEADVLTRMRFETEQALMFGTRRRDGHS